jgi:hypothetical protein
VVRFIEWILHPKQKAPLHPFGDLVGLRIGLDAVPTVEIKPQFVSLLAFVNGLRYPSSYYACARVRFHSFTGLFKMIVWVLTTCHTQYT